MEDFNIFAQLFKELDDFFNKKILIAGTQADGQARYLKSQASGYQFSQWQTLNRIELYDNSKFESGELDSEGQRKLFLNKSKFRRLVAAKQTDLDVKDFIFIPEELASVWGAYFMNIRFKRWAKETYFGELINLLNLDRPKYGSAVLKRVGKKLERVPLLTLRNQQDAKCLKSARYVIEEHKDMTYEEMEEMKEWDLSNISMDFGQKETVYERYGRVPINFYNKQKGDYEGKETKETVDCMSILTLKVENKKADNCGGSVLFIEKIDERPYEETHWERQDGRWLGLGEVENQFENQVASNMTANMRRRNALWSSKKVFQSADPDVSKNLISDVKDGQVLHIMPNGNISLVDTASRSIPEYQSMEDMWEKNSDQKSFTFEVATGESLPSGTPFRLGVVLSNAVNSHFALKREDFGLFFNRVIDNLVLPIFKKDNRDAHLIGLLPDEDGVERLSETLINLYSSQEAKKQLLSGHYPDFEGIKQKVTENIKNRQRLFIEVPSRYYEDLKTSTQLVITGEQIDIPKQIETYTNLFNTLSQRGDPRAEKALTKTIALTGENLNATLGPKPAQTQLGQMPAGQTTPMQMPNQVATPA